MKKNGVERSHYDNGQIRGEVTYVDGAVDGITRLWHENGVLAQEIPVKNNQIEGVAKQWNNKGKLLGIYEIRDGTGLQKIWHQNGQLMGEGYLLNGKLTGRQRAYFEDGEFAADTYYIKNAKVSKKKYLEACAKDPSLPQYNDLTVGLDLKTPATYRQAADAPGKERQQHEKILAEFRAKPSQREAREWLASAPAGRMRWLSEFASEESIEIVEQGYKAGALKITAVGIESDEDDHQSTNYLIVDLPVTAAERRAVFEWNNELAEESGFDADTDWGQNELFIFFD